MPHERRVPTALPVQRDLQRIPRGRARFQHYLRLIFSKQPKVVERVPLVAANPMAKEHVTELLDVYLALDADRIAAEAAREAAAALADVPGECYARLIIMDDLLGGAGPTVVSCGNADNQASPPALGPRAVRWRRGRDIALTQAPHTFGASPARFNFHSRLRIY